MKLEQFVFNPFGENTYLIWDETTRKAAIIDPGMAYQEEKDEIGGAIAANDLSLEYILLTHQHLDHTFGIDFISERFSPAIAGHKADIPLGNMRDEQARRFGVKMKFSPLELNRLVDDHDRIELGSLKITVIATPGHSQGGVCFYLPSENIIFTGDTLFKQSVGRTDLPGSNHATLISSIKNKLLTLPDDTIVYPGHGPATTIGSEKQANSFI